MQGSALPKEQKASGRFDAKTGPGSGISPCGSRDWGPQTAATLDFASRAVDRPAVGDDRELNSGGSHPTPIAALEFVIPQAGGAGQLNVPLIDQCKV